LKRGVRNPSKDVKNIFDEDEEEVLEENEEDFVVYDDGEDEGERHAPTLFEEVFHDLDDRYAFAFEKIASYFNFLLFVTNYSKCILLLINLFRKNHRILILNHWKKCLAQKLI